MTPDELQEILDAHGKWLNGDDHGSRADLSGADLRDADLRDVDLRRADLRDVDLRDVDLRDVDLRGADLRRADLRDADLRDVDLRDADLRGADLSGADLRDADLRRADLRDADLPAFSVVPDEGAFMAWKKAEYNTILKLEIPADAQRVCSLVGRKCRASAVHVLAAYRDGEELPTGTQVSGVHDSDFLYTVGETSYPDSFDDDIRVECSHGIHFFITRREAEEW